MSQCLCSSPSIHYFISVFYVRYVLTGSPGITFQILASTSKHPLGPVRVHILYTTYEYTYSRVSMNKYPLGPAREQILWDQYENTYSRASTSTHTL